MGWKLMAEVADYAPDTLTWREYAALIILGNAAWDSGKRVRQIPGIEGDTVRAKKLREQLRLSRTQRFEVIRSLVDKGALEHVERGRHGTGATYGIPAWGQVKHPPNRNPSPGEASRSEGRRIPVSGLKHPGTRDPQQTTTRQKPDSSSGGTATVYERAAAVLPSLTRTRYDGLLQGLTEAGKDNPEGYVVTAITGGFLGDLMNRFVDRAEEPPEVGTFGHQQEEGTWKPF